jgi:hypothetical protein
MRSLPWPSFRIAVAGPVSPVTGHDGNVEHDETRLNRLAIGMMAQPVRDVAEDEEHEGAGAVVEIAWPRHDRELPSGDDNDGGEPGINGELEPLDFGLPNAGLEKAALREEL